MGSAEYELEPIEGAHVEKSDLTQEQVNTQIRQEQQERRRQEQERHRQEQERQRHEQEREYELRRQDFLRRQPNQGRQTAAMQQAQPRSYPAPGAGAGAYPFGQPGPLDRRLPANPVRQQQQQMTAAQMEAWRRAQGGNQGNR